MDLQVITPMLTLLKTPVRSLHIEPTNACNAACPQCGRELGINFDKTLPADHLTVDQLKSIVTDNDIRGLDKVLFCGDYGDPAAGKHTLELMSYIRSVNPTITLGMNTNGSLRTTDWWRQVAEIMCLPTDYVVWSLDGLADTNHIYRVNTVWDKIIENVQEFIAAGGNAHWDMLVFKHNEHQVDQAQALAKELGFTWFRAKVSRRFDVFPVDFLSPPAGWTSATASNNIDCFAIKNSEIYVSAKGKLYPCCWMGLTADGTLDRFPEIQAAWTTDPHPTCSRTCSKTSQGTSFTTQWQREIALCPLIS